MNASPSSSTIDEYRVQARLLLKDLRSHDPGRQRSAAARLLALESFAALGVDGLVAGRERVRLKHSLAVVAAENGYERWTALKDAVEAQSVPDESTLMYDTGFDVLLNRWFAHYSQARESLEESGGFLLPYKSQFLVCESEAIRLLGLDPDDPDWESIGHDWVEPADRAASNRLHARRLAALARKEAL